MVTAHKKAEDVPPGSRGEFPTPVDWSLANADELNERHSRSYFIPPAARRRSLRPGELVRLEFRYGPHADREHEGHVERMWVEVLDQRADGHAHGRLRNHPTRFAALEIGDQVAFEPKHVTSIEYTDDELGYPQDQWPIIDKAITRDDRAPDIVVRAPGPYAAGQDAWWMLVRADPAGPTTQDVNSLTDRFPGLIQPLHTGEGLWELESGERGDAQWRRIAQDELESNHDWQAFLGWLNRTAAHMRKPSDGEPEP